MKIDSWQGCYPSNWKGVIIPEAMAHPAKYSSKLIRRIYEHMFQEGWLSEGDKVLDPFGGVALGALDAMRLGLEWTGVELEAKFHELGQAEYQCFGIDVNNWKRFYHRPKMLAFFCEHRLMCPTCEAAWNDISSRKIPVREPHVFRGNIALWANKFASMPKFGSARLLNGDSRKLLEMVQSVQASVSSPPFAGVGVEGDGRKEILQKGFNASGAKDARPNQVGDYKKSSYTDSYGSTPGQLGAMKGDQFQVALSSPPYAETDLQYKKNGLKVDGKEKYERPYMQGQGDENYGSTPGQLGAMKGDQFQAALSSPPYADISQSGGTEGLKKHGTGLTQGDACFDEYGASVGQLGKMKAEGFDAAISSPPFLQSEGGTPEPKPGGAIDNALYARHAAGNAKANGYGDSDGQLSSMRDGGFQGAISSPPYAATQVEKNAKSIDREKQYEAYKKSGGGQTFEQFCHTQELHSQGYGNSDGQLSSMPAASFQAALSSPPYAEARIGQESGQEQCGHGDQYGESDGQLGAMKGDGFDAAVSSPPYCAKDDRKVPWGSTVGKSLQDEDENRGYKRDNSFRGTYSMDPANLGNPTGANQDDFWLAARQIVEQVYLALAPGGHAVWVVKDYVKAKKIVPFCDQWRQLCEAVGFVTLHEHHAMLVHHKGTQHTLDGGMVEHKTESKSFFRRLAEKNGSPRIDWETVLCMEKPA